MPGSAIIPALRYRDAAAAIDWLCRAFGFESHMVVDGEDGLVAHAQLVYRHRGGDAMIMLGSVRDDEYGRLLIAPQDAGGANTQSVYVVVDDVDAHHRRAAAAGADVVTPPEEQDYGGSLYTCRDPEGHVWSFGSYDPWAE